MVGTQRRTARDIAWPVLVTVSWSFRGIFALTGHPEPAGKAVLVCVGFVLAGTGVGVTFTVLGLRRAQRLDRTPGLFRAEGPRPTDFLMMGLVWLSFAADPVFEGRTMTVGDWAFLVILSASGGALAGAALAMQQARVDRLSAHQETSATGS